MGVDFVVENVRGGSGAKAMAALATAPADGSIFYGTTPTFINTSILSDVEYTYEDLEPLVNVFFDPQIVYTRADSPFNSLAEVIDNAKQNPGQQSWGVSTPGSLDRQVMEKLKAHHRHRPGDRHPRGRRRSPDQRAERHPRCRRRRDPGAARPDRRRRGQAAGELHQGSARHLPRSADRTEQGIDLVVDKFRGLAGPKGLPDEHRRGLGDGDPDSARRSRVQEVLRGEQPGAGVHAA